MNNWKNLKTDPPQEYEDVLFYELETGLYEVNHLPCFKNNYYDNLEEYFWITLPKFDVDT